MRKTLTATALACAMSLSTATSSLAEGPETNMSQDQVKSAMLVSTQGSFGISSGPSSGPASSAQGSLSPVVIILGLLVIISIATTRGGSWYYPS